MAIKRGKTFSPYSYGVRYKTPGKNPYQKYTYIPGAGGGSNEPIYVISTKGLSHFSYIINNWYFYINEFNNISLLKCDSDIRISNDKVKESLNWNYIRSKYDSEKILIRKNEGGFKHVWINENTVEVFFQYDCMTDLVILFNDEFYNENCEIFLNIKKRSFVITFNEYLTLSDLITIIIYPIGYSINVINTAFTLNRIDEVKKIDDFINDRYLIKNDIGNINDKYLIFNSNNKIYNLPTYNVEPSYIEVKNNDILTNNEIDIKEVYSYYPIDNYETFIIQYGVDNKGIVWNDNIVKIFHNLNGNINYILDRNDYRIIIKRITKIDKDTIEVEFFKEKYIPNVFSLTLFKIGEN